MYLCRAYIDPGYQLRCHEYVSENGVLCTHHTEQGYGGPYASQLFVPPPNATIQQEMPTFQDKDKKIKLNAYAVEALALTIARSRACESDKKMFAAELLETLQELDSSGSINASQFIDNAMSSIPRPPSAPIKKKKTLKWGGTFVSSFGGNG